MNSKAKVQDKKESRFSIYDPVLPKTSKRIAAFIVDIILIIVLATGVAFIVSAIINMNGYINNMYEAMKTNGVWVEQVAGSGNFDYCDSATEACQAAQKACMKDPNYIYNARWVFYGAIIIISVAIFVSVLVFEFILPLILKHGRTIGMRFFDIGYVTDDGIDAPVKNLFIRFLFGKLLLNWLIPALSALLYIMGSLGANYALLGLIFFAVEILLNIYMLCFTPYKRGIADYIARLRPCDNSCQIYCKTSEELAANIAAEKKPR